MSTDSKINNLRAISLWQPWASLIAIGVKPYETRSCSTQYRGPLVIHAAKTKEGLYSLENPAFDQAFRNAAVPIHNLPLGAFVCIADLADCLPAEKVMADPFGDYSTGRFAWLLKNIRVFEQPIPSRGRQGLWRVHMVGDRFVDPPDHIQNEEQPKLL